ncbi:MAG: hypothetical protein ACAI25_11875 [Planctomycetota bacterium]
MTEGPAPEERARASRTLVLLAVFSLGFVVVFGGAVIAVRRLRARPPVLVLRLDVAPSGSVTLTFTNTSQAPQTVRLPVGERTGPEVEVVIDSGDATKKKGPIEVIGFAAVVVLEPGQSVIQDLPLDEYVALAGRATLHVERAKLAVDEPRLRSNSITVDRRP